MICAAIGLASCADGKAEQKPQTPEAGYIVVKAEAIEIPVTLPGRTAVFETSEVRPYEEAGTTGLMIPSSRSSS